ncbi:hypothetical protein LEP48_02345 [Isoptericola sp. NEAU-Y5]|uniref:Uncharacterized protein n=1 Tax=Isoptericola luteus TaxID=2879484 RepID=A0ABS7ZAU8_9MICO|nr:hypothetical protein [Isoptericola sp. NEAU-Y5]MCA5892188.1 hypothetical protein [Isoptericola sp. NEAU-Y5]
MVRGRRSTQQVLKAVRTNARRLGYAVEKLPKVGKGSHTIWVVVDPEGKEIGRIGLTGHSGQQSQKVTRSNEEALEGVFGEGWLDK